jgi:hypothetical protein
MTHDSKRELLTEVFKETLEGFFLILVIFMIMDKPWNKAIFWRLIKISLLIGAVNLGMALFDESGYVKVREGMKTSLGTMMLASAVGR